MFPHQQQDRCPVGRLPFEGAGVVDAGDSVSTAVGIGVGAGTGSSVVAPTRSNRRMYGGNNIFGVLFFFRIAVY